MPAVIFGPGGIVKTLKDTLQIGNSSGPQLSNSSGVLDIDSQVQFPAGSEASPSIKLSSFQSGFYNVSSSRIGLSVNGGKTMQYENAATIAFVPFGFNYASQSTTVPGIARSTDLTTGISFVGSGAFHLISSSTQIAEVSGGNTFDFKIAPTINSREIATEAGSLRGDDATAALSVGNWTDFDDGAVTTPVAMTGGSPANFSVARTTTSGQGLGKLGTAFAFTKANTADAQGEGSAVAFSIAESDRGKFLPISFNITTGSGFVNELVQPFIYDVTNAEIINIQTFNSAQGKLYATPSNGVRFTGLWQAASDSTSYRFGFMVIGTDTDDFSFYVSDIDIGSERTISSAKIRNVTANDLSTSSHTSSGSFQDVAWTEATDEAGEFDGTTYTAIGDGLRIVTANLSFAANATGFRGIKGVWSGGNDLIGTYTTSTGASGATSTTLANSIYMSDGDTLKIQGYQNSGGNLNYNTTQSNLSIVLVDSSDVMSTMQADSSTYYLRASRITSGQSISTASADTVIFNSIDEASHGDGSQDFNTSTGVWTAPYSGRITVSGQIAVSSFTADELLGIRIIKNGATTMSLFGGQATNTGHKVQFDSKVIKVVKGDTIEIQVDSTSDTSYTVDQTSVAPGSITFVEIEYKPDFSFFGVKGVYEYEEIVLATTTSTATANTPVDVSGSSITLPPGRHTLGYSVLGFLDYISGTPSAVYAGVFLTDSSNNVVAESFSGIYSGQVNSSTDEIATQLTNQVRINITESTTYKLRAVCTDTTAAIFTIYDSTTGFSGAITDPDCSSKIWRDRHV